MNIIDNKTITDQNQNNVDFVKDLLEINSNKKSENFIKNYA